MKHGQFVRWVNYQKTLLAVYHLSDGMLCYATAAELAADAGLAAATVRRQLFRLKVNRVVMQALCPEDGRRRPIALLDHPESLDYLRRNLGYFGPLSRQRELNRERELKRKREMAGRESALVSIGSGGALESLNR